MRLQARRTFTVGHQEFGGPHVITCVPLVSRDRGTLFEQACQLRNLSPDCIEWRADFLPDLQPDELRSLLPHIADAAGTPLLVTYRHQGEGGQGSHDEGLRLAILAAAARTGIPSMVDLELATDPTLAGPVIEAAGAAGVRVIRSGHNFKATPATVDMLEALRAAQASGADVAKLAVMPQEPEDVLRLLAAGLEARRTFLEIPCVLMAMGAMGGLSRLGGGYFGSDLTFAVGQESSAPGQMALDLVKAGLAALGLAAPN